MGEKGQTEWVGLSPEPVLSTACDSLSGPVLMSSWDCPLEQPIESSESHLGGPSQMKGAGTVALGAADLPCTGAYSLWSKWQ